MGDALRYQVFSAGADPTPKKRVRRLYYLPLSIDM